MNKSVKVDIINLLTRKKCQPIAENEKKDAWHKFSQKKFLKD